MNINFTTELLSSFTFPSLLFFICEKKHPTHYYIKHVNIIQYLKWNNFKTILLSKNGIKNKKKTKTIQATLKYKIIFTVVITFNVVITTVVFSECCCFSNHLIPATWQWRHTYIHTHTYTSATSSNRFNYKYVFVLASFLSAEQWWLQPLTSLWLLDFSSFFLSLPLSICPSV